MSMIQISVSQKRVMRLLNLAPVVCYQDATAALEAVEMEGSGIPHGHTWHAAAKLSDEQLLAAIGWTEERKEFGTNCPIFTMNQDGDYGV